MILKLNDADLNKLEPITDPEEMKMAQDVLDQIMQD